jgi:hypothetical protein
MQKNKAKILSAKQTLAKEAKNKNFLVACYTFALYKLIKLQIANIKVISLAQALNIVKKNLDKEKATTIITFNIILL